MKVELNLSLDDYRSIKEAIEDREELSEFLDSLEKAVRKNTYSITAAIPASNEKEAWEEFVWNLGAVGDFYQEQGSMEEAIAGLKKTGIFSVKKS